MQKIILCGGCFWGVEAYFQNVKGVLSTSVGYIGGSKANPTYEEVCSQKYLHIEACKINFDEHIITLENILKHFFKIIDPIAINRQGNDIGVQYQSAIFCFNDEQKRITQKIKAKISDKTKKRLNKECQTLIRNIEPFYEAEEYHQKYLDKNPNGYCHIDLSLAKK